MADPIQKTDENIVIRTMKGDLRKLSESTEKISKKPEYVPVAPISNITKEAKTPIAQEPIAAHLRPLITPEKPIESGPPALFVAPKIIPPKEIPETPTKPLFKATPVWLKISVIGLGILLIIMAGLYGYWKIFIQSQPPVIVEVPKIATTTPPTFPIAPTATTTIPIKFFNKLPNKEVTIDIASKVPAVLTEALKSEMSVKEPLASVKQIKITYQGKPITAEDFFNLMSIFAPKNFLLNYENEFILAFFSQKEGVRPILILKTKNRGLEENQMKSWETISLPSDILPLFLTDFKLPQHLLEFKSYLFIGQPVRYLNINMPFASLNYAIYNNFLIFTTSSAGMFVILQDLTGQSASQNYLENLKASINEFVR